jgi:RNA polymerase sigma-70 factor (ECF subfamily)
MPNVDAIADPRSYALQIARSLVLQHVRRAKIVRIGSLSEQEDLDCASDHPTPEQQAVGRDELLRVTEAIEAMPEAVKRAFWLRRVEGLPQREIANRLGLSINTVEKQISRGIKILVEQFARGGGTPPRASSNDEAQHEGPVLNVRARVGGED